MVGKYSKASNNKPYGCINPYNVLICKNDEVLLLNMDEESNDFVNSKMENEVMKENYKNGYAIANLKRYVRKDFYTFGMTVNYIMAKASSKIRLSIYEQKRLVRFVNKCIGKSRNIFENYREIEDDLYEITDETYKRVTKKTTAVISILVLLLVILSFVLVPV